MVVLDLTQSLGVAPISGHALSCADFAVASTHKWLLGLYGIAVMWVNPKGIGKVCLATTYLIYILLALNKQTWNSTYF